MRRHAIKPELYFILLLKEWIAEGDYAWPPARRADARAAYAMPPDTYSRRMRAMTDGFFEYGTP